jgi:hypothetical protein
LAQLQANPRNQAKITQRSIAKYGVKRSPKPIVQTDPVEHERKLEDETMKPYFLTLLITTMIVLPHLVGRPNWRGRFATLPLPSRSKAIRQRKFH